MVDLFCSLSALDPTVGHPWTYLHFLILHLSLSSVILIDSIFHGESCHVLMLSIQVVRALPRLCAPGIVPCIISFYGQLPLSSWCDHSICDSCLAYLTVSNSSLFITSFVKDPLFVFFAMHKTHRIFLSPFISKASIRISSFFLSVQLSVHSRMLIAK